MYYYQLLSRQGFFLLWSIQRLLPSGTFPTLMWSDASCLGLLQHSPFFLPRPHSTIGRRLERFNMGERYLSDPFTKFIIIPSVQLHGENIRKKWWRWKRRQQGREEGEGGKEQVQEEGAQLEVSSGKIQATYFWKVSPCSPNIYSQAEQDESILFLSIEEVFIPSAFSSLKYLKSHPDGEGQWEEAEKKRQASRHPAAAARLPRPRHDDVGRGRGALPWTVWRAWRPYREAWHLIQTGDNGIRSIKSI